MSNPQVDGQVNIVSKVDEQSIKATEQKISSMGQAIGKAADKAEKEIIDLGKAATATGEKVSKAMQRINQSFANQSQLIGQRRASQLDVESAKQAGGITAANARIRIEQEKGEQSRKTLLVMREGWEETRRARDLRKEQNATLRQQNKIEQEKLKAEESIQRQIAAADKFRTQEGFRQLAISDRFKTANLNDIRAEIIRREGRRSPNLAQFPTTSGSGRGGIGGVLGRLLGGGGGGIAGSLLAGLAGGFGIGVGGYAIARGVSAVVEATDQATAYDRQRVAAEKLAGSQEQLNQLLAAYAEASGGAINQATSLETVTRLLATGYAKTVPQLERFVRATRGASLSLGKPQEFVAQETQLAISNTSVKRLDQIGLGIDEVTQRTEELRESNKSLTREMAFGEAVLSLMEEKYGALSNSLEGQATGVEKLRRAWADLFLTLGQSSQGPVNTIAGTLARLVEAYTPTTQTGSGQTQAKAGRNAFDEGFNRFVETLQDFVVENVYGFDPTRIAAARALQRGTFRREGTSGYVGGPDESIRPPSSPLGRDPELQAVIDSAYDNIQQVEKNANQARLREIENYESQRESIINNYGKMVVREEEDFTRQRARSLRDYERSIMDVMRDARDREAEMQEDLDRQLADAREDSNERVIDLQEKHNEDREKAEKDHRDAMLTATGQLDAFAVLEERKRFRREQEERNKQHNKAVEEEKESLQERIDDAIEAHEERLEDARKADARRLEDMRVAREQQLDDEDEDRQIRLDRAAEDHQDQLDELDRQHEDRLQQIKDQAAEETQAIKDALAEDLAEAGFYIKGMTEIMEERKKLQEEWFDAMIERMERDIEYEKRREQVHDPRITPERVIPEFARGGTVANTGLAYVHAGERIIPAGATHYNNGGNSLVIEDGAFRISTTPGMEMAVGESIEEVLIKLLERV